MGCEMELTPDSAADPDYISKTGDENSELCPITAPPVEPSDNMGITIERVKRSRTKGRAWKTKKCKEKGGGDLETRKWHACDFPGCEAKFSRPWKLSAHRCQHTGHRPFECSRVGCNKSYTNPAHLRRHDLKAHQGKDKEKKNAILYKCLHPNCSIIGHRGFQTLEGLKKHEKKHEDVEARYKSFPFKCADCKMAFKRPNELKTHRFQHDGILPFKCEVCELGFLHYYDYSRHARGHKEYKCPEPECPAEIFGSWNLLRAHMTLHNNFTCDFCKKSFSMKCRLRVHVEETHLVERQPDAKWNCTVEGCGRSFTLRRNMLQHVRHRHEGTGFACPYNGCAHTFIWKTSLEKHVVVHQTGRLPKPVRMKKPRSRRKDADIPKGPKSTAAELLSSVVVDSGTKTHLKGKEDVDTDEEMIEEVSRRCASDERHFADSNRDEGEEEGVGVMENIASNYKKEAESIHSEKNHNGAGEDCDV